jgi:hypothetical protein
LSFGRRPPDGTRTTRIVEIRPENVDLVENRPARRLESVLLLCRYMDASQGTNTRNGALAPRLVTK